MTTRPSDDLSRQESGLGVIEGLRIRSDRRIDLVYIADGRERN